MPLVPFLPEIQLHIRGAFRIDVAQQPFGFGFGPRPLLNAAQTVGPRRVDKDVEDIRAVLQNALRAPPHDYAIAGGMRLLDNLPIDSRHGFGIENVNGRDGGHRLQTRVPERPADAVQPGIDMLVAGGDGLDIHSRRVGDLINEIAVEQLPAEGLGRQGGDLGSAAPVLPRYCQYSVLHWTLLLPGGRARSSASAPSPAR